MVLCKLLALKALKIDPTTWIRPNENNKLERSLVLPMLQPKGSTIRAELGPPSIPANPTPIQHHPFVTPHPQPSSRAS